MDVLVVGSVVHDGYFHRCTLLFGVDVDDIVHQMLAGRIDVAYKLLQALYGIENFLLVTSVFFFYAKVGQRDFDSGIQISQLAHTSCQNIIIVDRFGKDCIIRPELLARTCNLGSADFLYRIKRMSAFVFLLIDFSVTENLGSHVRGQCVHTRYADTVQTTGYFIRALVELTTGVQHSHNNFES